MNLQQSEENKQNRLFRISQPILLMQKSENSWDKLKR